MLGFLPGRGTYVASIAAVDARIDRLQRASASPGILNLGGGLPADELFPREELSRAFLEAMRRPRCPALQYGWPEGEPELRAWIAERLRRRGDRIEDGDVIVTNGAQQAIAIAVEHLVARGTEAGVDPETYPAALDLFRACAVTASTRFEGAHWLYRMPGIANPRGGTLSSEARRQLVDGFAGPIIADEAYADLRFDGKMDPPLRAAAPHRVWHVGTLSKSLCPGLRVGWLVPPPSERAAVLETKHARDLQAGSLAQSIAWHFLSNDDFDARLVAARTVYARRAARLVSGLRRWLPCARFQEPAGGFSVFVETDADGDDIAFLAHALEHGVSVDPGSQFRPDGRVEGPLAFRLCYSAVSEASLEEAVRRLAKALGTFSSRSARLP